MFAERRTFLAEPLQDVAASPLGPWKDDAWSRLPEDTRRTLITKGEDALQQPWPQLLATDYRAYVDKGDRARFEALYFDRRLKLNHLVLAECAEGEGRFVDAIIDGLWLIAEESGWQLPAHNAYARGGQRLPLPDPDNPVIDLFAAETAANLATVIWLLRAPIDAIDPRLCLRLEREIDRRIFHPYLARHFWWMGQGDERMNNWTAWITQNVLLAAFLLPTDQSLRRQVAEKALGSLDAFIKDYAEDGACEEGVAYYRHAALCLFGAMTVLDAASPGLMQPLWTAPKIHAMAEFILHMHLAGHSYFNFADAAAVVEPCGAREFLFGKAVGSPALQAFAVADWRGAEDALQSREWNLWYRLLAIASAAEMAAWTRKAPAKTDIFYPGIGLAIARDDHVALAVKGGTNGESHNHNDVGSVTLYLDGQPLLIDVGVETYTAKTFSPRRYEIWTMQSAFHNLPSFGGVMQQDGEAFSARDMTVRFDAEDAEISLDLAGAYPPEAEVTHYRRTVHLIRNRGLAITDRHEGKKPAVLSLMTVVPPAVDGNIVHLEPLAEIRVDGAGAITVESLDITDPRLRQSWPERLYRLLVPLNGPTLTLTIIRKGTYPCN